MSKRKQEEDWEEEPRKRKKRGYLGNDTVRGITIVCLFMLGALSVLSLIDLAGPLGSTLNRGWQLALGWGRWASPVLLIATAVALLKLHKPFAVRALVGIFLLTLSFTGLLHLSADDSSII
ncbi:MAG: hypothetical protein V1707_01290, partial [bacterium]